MLNPSLDAQIGKSKRLNRNFLEGKLSREGVIDGQLTLLKEICRLDARSVIDSDRSRASLMQSAMEIMTSGLYVAHGRRDFDLSEIENGLVSKSLIELSRTSGGLLRQGPNFFGLAEYSTESQTYCGKTGEQWVAEGARHAYRFCRDVTDELNRVIDSQNPDIFEGQEYCSFIFEQGSAVETEVDDKSMQNATNTIIIEDGTATLREFSQGYRVNGNAVSGPNPGQILPLCELSCLVGLISEHQLTQIVPESANCKAMIPESVRAQILRPTLIELVLEPLACRLPPRLFMNIKPAEISETIEYETSVTYMKALLETRRFVLAVMNLRDYYLELCRKVRGSRLVQLGSIDDMLVARLRAARSATQTFLEVTEILAGAGALNLK